VRGLGVDLGAEFDPADVAYPHDPAAIALVGLDDDVAELFGRAQAPDDVDRVLEIEPFGRRRLADLVLSFGRQTARYTKLSLSTVERRRQSIANWRGLVQSILAGNARDAERFARQLVFDTRDTALGMLADGMPEAAKG